MLVQLVSCGIPAAAQTAFEPRIRHLRRLGVPSRASEERMSRFDHGVAKLAALATAVHLMTSFMQARSNAHLRADLDQLVGWQAK